MERICVGGSVEVCPVPDIRTAFECRLHNVEGSIIWGRGYTICESFIYVSVSGITQSHGGKNIPDNPSPFCVINFPARVTIVNARWTVSKSLDDSLAPVNSM